MKKLILLISISILVGCEKGNTDYPITYTFNSFETGKVRIFTKNGEIENNELSDRFIDKWDDYFYKPNSFSFDFDYNGDITLNSNGQSTIYTIDTTINCSYKDKNGVLYFESSDTSYSNVNLINMKDIRFEFGPITQTDIKKGTISGYPPIPNWYYGYHPCAYAIISGNDIKFPFTSFLEKNCFGDDSRILGNCYNISAVSNINNLFNKSYIQKLFNNAGRVTSDFKDTIVIQENYIVFKKTNR